MSDTKKTLALFGLLFGFVAVILFILQLNGVSKGKSPDFNDFSKILVIVIFVVIILFSSILIYKFNIVGGVVNLLLGIIMLVVNVPGGTTLVAVFTLLSGILGVLSSRETVVVYK